MSAPAYSSGAKDDGPVVNLGKCSLRNKIGYDAKGLEYKCSISGGGLRSSNPNHSIDNQYG
jgi:hypothetical protein